MLVKTVLVPFLNETDDLIFFFRLQYENSACHQLGYNFFKVNAVVQSTLLKKMVLF